MKIQLTKTLPQPELGRVIPAGVIIDAPPALAERLQRTGAGIPAPASRAPGEPKNGAKAARKKVKRDA